MRMSWIYGVLLEKSKTEDLIMLRDMKSNTSVVQALAPANRALGSYYSPTINAAGSYSIMVVVMVGAVANGGSVSVSIEESDLPSDDNHWQNIEWNRLVISTQGILNAVPANTVVSIGVTDVGGLTKGALRVQLGVNGGAVDCAVLVVLGNQANSAPGSSIYLPGGGME